MIDSTAFLEPTTIMLCCSCAMCFSAAACSENDHGSMNLASNTAPVSSTSPSRVAAIQTIDGWTLRRWHLSDPMAGLALIPGPIELLGHQPELDDQLARQIGRLDLAALFLPQPDQGRLVAAHDDAGVGAADEVLTVRPSFIPQKMC